MKQIALRSNRSLVRLGLVLTATASLTLGLTACSSAATTTETTGAETAAAQTTSTEAVEISSETVALDTFKVEGGFGIEPKVTGGDPEKLSAAAERKELFTGDGEPVSGDSYPALKVATFSYTTGEVLSSYSSLPIQSTMNELGLPEPIHSALLGTPSGSRVAVLVVPPGSAAENAEDDAVVFVIDVLSFTANQAADGKPVESTIDGIEVTDGADGSPTVTVSSDVQKSDEHLISTVREGDGAVVAEGDDVIVQYRGVLLDGTEFDSSWARGGVPAMFSTEEVVPGFGDALIGQHVGSRVVTVFPPELGYGDQASGSIPAGSHLVFVVDILGVFPATTGA